MSRFLSRIIICLVPTILSIAIVAWAYNEYMQGRGGFRMGVDLVGGTILVYEVDETKMPDNFHATDLAAALKKRIDPNDLYNITIRPIDGQPPRVEIILPTGGQFQAQAAQAAWDNVLEEAFKKFPVKDAEDNPYKNVPRGRRAAALLTARILDENNKAGTPLDAAEVEKWVEANTSRSSSRALTGDEVENIKGLISQQGRMEFKILANEQDDKSAIGAARAFMENPANKAVLVKANNQAVPPPPPLNETGGRTFTADIQGNNEPFTYEWVLLGKSELYSLGLNSEELAAVPALEQAIKSRRASGTAFTPQDLSPELPEAVRRNARINSLYSCLFYTREIPQGAWGYDSRPIEEWDLGKRVEYFVLVRNGIEIKGDDLVSAREEMDGRDGSGRAIAFMFNAEGGERFHELTSKNVPSGSGDVKFYRHLAILFDNQVVSAPRLQQAIRTNGQITGNFSQQEVEDMVRILRAGALPATLKREPVSQNSMGATLGEDTIRNGTRAVFWSFLAVMVFMILYYQFAGVVACIALLANLVLTVAFMVVVNAAFTLPGLAGLVLMLGMAVDANVLIYERLREERDRGATLAQALRNGYDKAFPTIIDSHLSSIFTAIVLYVVGNDQLKGFGISLTVGLFISLFTSLYMTRTIFEVAMADGWIKELSFYQGFVKLIHMRYWDFMSIRHYWFAATAVLTIAGALLFLYRADRNPDPAAQKATVLNIDFTGGAAITARLSEPRSLTWLREKLEKPQPDTKFERPLPDMALEQLFLGGDTLRDEDGQVASYVFTLRTSERNLETVMDYVSERIGKENLKLLNMTFTPLPEAVVLKYEKPTSEAAPGTKIDLTFAPTRKAANQPAETTARAALDRVQAAFDAESKVAGLPPEGFSLAGLGEAPKDNRFEKMELTLKQKVDTGKLDAWLVAAGKRLAAPIMVRPDTVIPLKFTNEKGEKDFASPSQIQSLLNEGFKYIGRSTFALERPTGTDSHDPVTGLYSQLDLRIRDEVESYKVNEALERIVYRMEHSPVPERLEHFDSQLAESTQQKALVAIAASWIAILLYLWLRFGNWTFGAAAVICLVHDLLFTLGCVAACHYIYNWAPWLAYPLGIQDFKIDLNTVAALLTLVGYSVNDTIVVFDRIREVRGKSPQLTFQMINDSVNQTLTRTLLASATVLLVVLVLYIFGGEGVKLFAFVMIIGVFVGTYSSIYIASPLLILFGEGSVSPALQDKPATTKA